MLAKLKLPQMLQPDPERQRQKDLDIAIAHKMSNKVAELLEVCITNFCQPC